MSGSSVTQSQRDEWRRLLATADPAPWRFELGTSGLHVIGHILTGASSDKPWTDAPILCSHIFGPRDAANYALMAAAPTAIRGLLDEVECLDIRVADAIATAEDFNRQRVAAGRRIAALEVEIAKLIAALEAEIATLRAGAK